VYSYPSTIVHVYLLRLPSLSLFLDSDLVGKNVRYLDLQ
jgi:hypothetical protein